MNTLRLIALMSAIVLFPLDAMAAGDSGTEPLRTGPDRTSSECTVRAGRDCHFAFDSTAVGVGVNSKVFQVNVKNAVACLAPMHLSNTVGVVKFWKVVGTSSVGTQINSMVPSAASASSLSLASNTDCFVLSTGRWWIEVTTAASLPTATADAIVIITGSME